MTGRTAHKRATPTTTENKLRERKVQMGDGKRRAITREAILAKNDVEYREVEVPEWGDNGTPAVVRLRSLTAGAAIQFARDNKNKEELEESAVRIVVMSVVDDDGKFIFTNSDVQLLKERSMKVIIRLQQAAMEMNGLAEPVKAAEIAKNV